MKRQIKILRNAIRCKNCGEVIESKSRHDFVECKCFRESGGTTGVFVDGGHDYLRRGGDLEGYEDLSESRLYTDEERDEYNKHRELLAEQYGWINIDYME